MALGVQLRGTAGSLAPSAAASLRRIEEFLRNRAGDALSGSWLDDPEGSPALWMQLHPAAEPARFAFDGDGTLTAQARTSSVGPGFHIFVCDLLRELGEALAIEWTEIEDDTTYFATRDDGMVYVEMQAWLRAVVERCLAMQQDRCHNLMIAMPSGHVFHAGEALVTPLGPRNQQWMQEVITGARSGSDFFAWWNDRRDATYYLRRALCLMWREVRWRAPLLDGERKLLREVTALLERGYALDPEHAWPAREWREIAGYLGADAPALPAPAEAPPIGYRRGAVAVSLAGGWHLEIPGSFAEAWRSDELWHAFDSGRDVWFSAFRARPAADGSEQSAEQVLRQQPVTPGEQFEFEEPGYGRRASFGLVEENGRSYWRLLGRTTTSGRFSLVTIAVASRDDLEWALGVWRSVRRAE